jgi:hypothetical protein
VILTAASGLQTFQQTLTTGSTLTTNNTVNQGTHNFIWTGGGLHQFDSTRYTQGYINPVLVADSLSAFGNSIGLGANATLIPDSGFNGRLARNYQKVLYNHSISGIKIYDIIGINMATINPGHHSFTSFEGGINDLRSFSSSNVFNAINNCFNAAIINQYLSSYVSGSDASITRTGTWTINYPINNAGFGKTATAAYTNNHIGDHADWTSPISTSVALQVSGQVGVGATITVVIDGVTVDNIVTANQVETGSYIPMARVYTGLSNATHSVTLTYSGGSGLFILDYLGVVTATPTMPFVAFDVPYLFFTSGTGAGNDTKIRTDTVNNRIAATVAFYRAKGWPVYHAPVNNYYTATLVVDLSSDSVHPNNTGHARIYQSALATINASSFTGGTLVYSNDGHFYGQSLTGLNQLAYFSEVNLQAALTNGSAMLTNMFINGNGFSASFSNFTTMSFDSILIIKNTGNPSTAIVNVHGQFAAYGASAAIQVLSRNGDTTKGFQFVTGGGAISVSDLFNGGRNIIQIDSGYRARFIHDANSITVNSSPVMSTVYIDGNRNGRAGYTSFKIDSGVLVTTPEKYAIENNGLHFYWTDRTGTRFQLDQQSGGSGVTTVGSFSGSSIANGASISTTTITFGPADATNPGMIKNTGSQTLGATLTMPAPFFTSLSSSGANDSVLTVDPSTGQVHRRAGNQSLFFANGLTAATADSVYLGGSLNHNTTLGTAGFNFSITGLPNKSTALSTDSVLIGDVAGKLWKLPVPSATTPTLQQVLTAGSVLTSTSGITLGNNNLTIGGFSGSGQVFINNPLQLAFAAVNTDADYTVGPENGVILQATITASRNLVLPTNSGGSQAGRIFYVDNSNPTNFLWTISAAGGASVKDASGNTITTLQKGINYVFSGGSGSVWRLISTSRLGGPISNDLTGQTTAATVTSYAVPGSGSFNTFSVGGYLTVTAVSLDVIQLQVAYTDETNTSRTQSFFVQGATTGISATGANGYSPINIRVKQGTTITVSTVLTTGTGSITYDVGASIIQIY